MSRVIHRRNKHRSAPIWLWIAGALWVAWDRAVDRGWDLIDIAGVDRTVGKITPHGVLSTWGWFPAWLWL